MTQNLIRNAVETNAVIDLIEKKLGPVDQHVIDITEYTFCILNLLSLSVIEIKFLLATKRTYPCGSLFTQ